MAVTHKTTDCSTLTTATDSSLTWAANPAKVMVAAYRQMDGARQRGQTYLLGTSASSSRQKAEANILLLAQDTAQQTGMQTAQSTSQATPLQLDKVTCASNS